MHVLVLEDDEILGRSLQRGLETSNYQCTWLKNGAEALRKIRSEHFDLMILDLMVPDLPGLDILRLLRQDGITTPVLILTALGSVDERVAGLRAGADDYLVKPFAFPELLARLDAIGRRSQQMPSNILKVGTLELDITTRRVTRDNREIDLTPTEFNLLEFLARNAGQVVTRKMLCEHLWEADWEGVTNVIEVHINRLRGKIDRKFPQPLLHTIRGRGYVLRPS